MGDHLSYEEKDAAASRLVASLEIGQRVLLVFEPDNPASPNKAIAVYLNYERIGYIADEECELVRPLLNGSGRAEASVVRKDGHVTFFVTIPGAKEDNGLTSARRRILPESPLGDSFRMPFTREENALQVIAGVLSETEATQENLQEVMLLTERYVPLAKVSICHDDKLWRRNILRKLEHVLGAKQELGMSDDEVRRMEAYCSQVRDAVGDMHRSAEHWPERVFESHLDRLRNDSTVIRYLYQKYCETFLDGKSFDEAETDLLKAEYDRLSGWLKGMKWSELRNPRNLRQMGYRAHYLGLSRTELYDLYSVLLLIERLEAALEASPAKKTQSAEELKAVRNPKKTVADKPQKPRVTMTFRRKGCVLDGHLTMLFNRLVTDGWIDGNEADFIALFSGKPDEDCQLTWKEKYGKGTLVELFRQMVGAALVIVPDGYTLPSILEGHFKDDTGAWLTGLDKGNSANQKALPFILQYLKLLKLSPNSSYEDDDDDFQSQYDPYDHQDLKFHKGR